MLREVLVFELRQQLKSPLFWAIAIAFAALAFAAAGSDHIRVGGGIGNTHRNAPYVVVQMLALFTVIGMFLIAVFVAGAALRDFDAGMAEMIFATPISRGAYLGGRFAAGYLASVGVLVVVSLGIYLGVLMPWVDPARLGDTPFAAYGYAFAVFVFTRHVFYRDVFVPAGNGDSLDAGDLRRGDRFLCALAGGDDLDRQRHRSPDARRAD